MNEVTIIGAGLAGSECALSLADKDISSTLYEMRPTVPSPAHHTGYLAELVCSNSLKSDRADSAAGELKRELALMGSRLLPLARAAAVAAGGALAVDRERFAQSVTRAVEDNPLIELRREEVTTIPDGPVVIAAGPLCSDALSKRVAELVGHESLSFFDAAAPIVDAETIDYDVVFSQSRYEELGMGDYLNCPFDKEAYEAFWNELVNAQRVIGRDFETKDLFQACQPVEEVARHDVNTLRFGALKPVGICDPTTGRRPWAVVQLRAENEHKSAYNLVGFQTNLTWGEQKRVFRMIPGLENAEFLRYGVMHRNTFVDAPRTLDATFKVPGTQVRLAGQICGTEGYVEAMASGALAAANVAAELKGLEPVRLPETSVFGALVAYATNPETSPYQPMHVNFGLVPPLETRIRNKRERAAAYADRAFQDLAAYLKGRPDLFGDPGDKPLPR